MTKFIVKTVNAVFIGLLAIMILAMSVYIFEEFVSGWLAFFGGVILLAGIITGLVFFRERIRKVCVWICNKLSGVSPAKMMVILFLFSVITKVFFIFLFDVNVDEHPDMKMYRSFAKQIAETGKITENTEYAMRHAYTVIFGLFLSPIAKVFGSDSKTLATALVILNSIGLVLIFDILKKFVRKEIAFTLLLSYSITPMAIIQSWPLLHENGLLFTHVLSFWIFLKALDNKKNFILQLLLVLVSALIISFGKSMNASGRVIVVSYIIYIVAKMFEGGFDSKKLIRVLSFVLCFALCYFGASKATLTMRDSLVEQQEETEKNWVLSKHWPLYIGWNYDERGTWNEEDWETYCKWQDFETKEEAQEYQREIVEERLKSFPPSKIVPHLFNKMKVLWGTQIFGDWFLGGNSLCESVFWGYGGAIRILIIAATRLIFLVMYSILLLSQIRSFKNKIKVTPDLHCKMTVIGVTLALLLFEVTPKYTSHLHIILFFALAMSVKNFFKKEKCGEEITTTPEAQSSN